MHPLKHNALKRSTLSVWLCAAVAVCAPHMGHAKTIRPMDEPMPLTSVDDDIQNTVRGALQTNTPLPFVPNQAYDRSIELVFAIDTTGSMSGLIDGAKQKIWRIINDVTAQQKKSGQKVLVRVGLVAYRDKNETYETLITPLSADLDAVYSQLMGYQAEGGGDTPEHVRKAMLDATRNVGWSERARDNRLMGQHPHAGRLSQVLFLVGDAPPHDDYRQYSSAQTYATHAHTRGITVNAIQVGNIRETEPIWRAVAQQGGGEYFAIAQNGGVQTVVTPYDDQLAHLGDQISAAGLYYGDKRAQVDRESKAYASSISAAAPSAAKADRALNKAMNKESAYHAQDLVQAVDNKSVQLADIPVSDLPETMQKMSATERQAYIEQKIAERERIRSQITELSKQRDVYLREHEGKQGAADAFDTSVAKALNRQIQ